MPTFCVKSVRILEGDVGGVIGGIESGTRTGNGAHRGLSPEQAEICEAQVSACAVAVAAAVARASKAVCGTRT